MTKIEIRYTPKILTQDDALEIIKKHPKAKITYTHEMGDSYFTAQLSASELLKQCIKYCVELEKESDEELVFYGYDITQLW